MKRYTDFLIACAMMGGLAMTGCQLDERVGDLTAGYAGAFIDKNTGDTVATEHFAAKIKLLDLKYGERAIPLEYEVNPQGFYSNYHCYPSDYKMWAVGPFCELDTIYSNFADMSKPANLKVVPNVSLEITKVEVKYGIAVDVTYSYSVNDPKSNVCDAGIVYGTTVYPGFRVAMDETATNAAVKKRIHANLTERTGEFTETLYLEPNQKYYIRALSRSENGGDYWNYSSQYVVQTTDVDISSLPVEANLGVSSATSAILQWAFPPLVDNIRVSYTDCDGEQVSDLFSPQGFSYVANLPHNSTNQIKVQLISGDVVAPERTIEVKTKALEEKYVSAASHRPENVPFYNDRAFKMSLSGQWAVILGPSVDPSWVTSPLRFEFFDWWNTWLMNNDNMPSCQNIEEFTEFVLQGNVQTLVDILPFVNLETLSIVAGEGFDVGATINPNVDLTVLCKLKKLKKIILGSGVSLTEEAFRNAGLTHVEIVRQ